MATFNVAHLITLIGVGSIASSVVADDQQNQNKTAQNGGGGLKHLFGTDVFTELRDKQNAMAEKMSGIETKLEKQIENGGGTLALMTMLTSNRLEKEIEDGMRENRNAMAEKMSGIEAKLEKQIENGMRDSQNLLSTKLENAFITLRDNQNASVTKLENRIENGMRDNQNALSQKVSEIGTKLENQIENVFTKLRDNQNASVTKLENQIENGMLDKQNALDEKVSGIEAKLEQIENGMRDIQNLLSTKLEKGMRDNQKALSLMKKMATLALFHFNSLPIYRWNASDCHPEIVINESTNAIQHNGTKEFINGIPFPILRSCRAGPIKIPFAADRIGIIYTEYRILAENGVLKIGLSTKEMPLYLSLGFARVSYGYETFGEIRKNANGNYENISDNVPSFRIGDMVGCGLNWATGQVFFTKNGQRLDIANLYVDEGTEDLYPTVSLTNHLDAVEANFGPNFKYDLSKEF
ncbi:hypothetical protein niasHT_000831 [Heterodera trifolii]|uniref:B30.2/SPRY domain-containing protein n=1 Tax=Heterodera trifolii TaxID=157864 RepID=A0ABD2MAJ3_9BILA